MEREKLDPGKIQTGFDRLIARLAPTLACKRMYARVALETAVRSYEGAKKGPRTDGWVTSGGSANAEIGADAGTLRERARALVQDNGWISSAIDTLEEKIIGTGLKLQLQGPGNEKLLEDWKAWSESTECDSEGNLTLAGIASLVVRSNVEGGEALIRRRPRRSSDGLTVPLQLQFLEPDYLDSSRDTSRTDSGGKIIQGIEFDRLGRRIAYHLFREHPGDMEWSSDWTSKRHTADKVAHVFKVKRGNQARGVTWLHALVHKMRGLDEFGDARLVQAKIAACFAGVLYDMEVPDNIPSSEDFETMTVRPGTLMRAPSGLGVTFPNPPSFVDAAEHVRGILLCASSCLGLTYEEMTGDYSGTNYSSGRMAFIASDKKRKGFTKKTLVPQFYDQVFRWFLFARGMASGEFQEGLKWSWAPPRRELVDPLDETEAKAMNIEKGLKSWQETIREDGGDPDEVLGQFIEDEQRFEKAGLPVPWRAEVAEPAEPGADAKKDDKKKAKKEAKAKEKSGAK